MADNVVDVLSEDYIDRSKLILVAFISNLGAMLLGLDYGMTSYLLTDIDYFASSSQYSSYTYFSTVENSSVLLGFLASGASIGTAITFALLILYGNSISKKDELLLAAMLYFIGAMLESCSYYFSWKHVTGLVFLSIGRLVFGAGAATSYHASPHYVAEIAPANIRGNIGSATEVMTASGVVLGYILGYASSKEDGWAQVYLVGYIVALIMGCLALYIPHSPKWMARHNFPPGEILESLQFLYPNATDSSVLKLRKECEIERAQSARMEELWKTRYGNSDSNWFQSLISTAAPDVKFLFYDKVLSRCLSYGLILVILNTATGHAAILYYAGSIFDQVCSRPNACVVGLGFAKLIPALLMTVIADIFGRRIMLMTGTIIVTLGLTTIAGGYAGNNDDCVVVGMYIAVAGWALGFGSMIWFIMNELFPYFVRPAGMSILSFVLTTTTIVILWVLPSLRDVAGYFGCFLIFTIFGCLALLFIYLFQPETKGADLEQSYRMHNTNYAQALRRLGYQLNDDENEYDALLPNQDRSALDGNVAPIHI